MNLIAAEPCDTFAAVAFSHEFRDIQKARPVVYGDIQPLEYAFSIKAVLEEYAPAAALPVEISAPLPLSSINLPRSSYGDTSTRNWQKHLGSHKAC